jgi:hypothetical protein
MPGAHRDNDSRFCGASTQVIGQSTVFVNNKLWAVEGDICTHGNGLLYAVYGAKNIYVENKLIICAVGDRATPDNLGHPAPPTDPLSSSTDTTVYDGASGGGTVS